MIIHNIKKLNAAYIAALEYDTCPDSDKAKQVYGLQETGLSLETLREALDENYGRRPDEIASQMANLITQI